MSKKKKLIIGVAALVVLGGLLVLLLLQNRYVKLSEDGDPMECAYRVTGKTLKLRIRGEFPEGYEWKALTDESCEAKLIMQKKDKIYYELRNTGEEPIFTVRFLLQKPGVLPDISNMITADFFAETNGKLSCLQLSQKVGRSPKTNAEDSAYPFRTALTEFGEIVLEMPCGEAGGWTYLPAEPYACRIEKQAAETTEYEYFLLSPLRYGREETLFFLHEKDGAVLPLTLKIDSTGNTELAVGAFTVLLGKEEAEKKLQETKYDPERLMIFVPEDMLRLLAGCGGEEAVAAYLEQQGIAEELVLPRSQPEEKELAPEDVQEMIDIILKYAGTEELRLTAEVKEELMALLRDCSEKEEMAALRESIEQAIAKLAEAADQEVQPEETKAEPEKTEA